MIIGMRYFVKSIRRGFLIIIFLLILIPKLYRKEYKVKPRVYSVICYYGSWAAYRPGNGQFNVENIDTKMCTHLIYAFAGVDRTGKIISLDPWLDLPPDTGKVNRRSLLDINLPLTNVTPNDPVSPASSCKCNGTKDNYAKFNALKKKKPELKTLLSVGGWKEESEKYSMMAANATLRRNFVNSAIWFLQIYGFDGLDVDWEYPNGRNTVYGLADLTNYTKLLKELRKAFRKFNFLLTAAVYPYKSAASNYYYIRPLARYVDFIHLMTYDSYGPWDQIANHNSALHKGEAFYNDDSTEKLNTVDEALLYWLENGCPPHKLAVGIPFFGHTYQLSNPVDHYPGAPAHYGVTGPYTSVAGVLGYNEINVQVREGDTLEHIIELVVLTQLCSKLDREKWTKRLDSEAKAPYAYKGSDWMSYDDAYSIAAKINYAKDLGIHNIMVWSIDMDDFHGTCGTGVNPLLRCVNEALDIKVPSPSIELSGSLVIGSNSSDDSAALKHVCQEEGFFPNPEIISSFYRCTRDFKGDLKLYKLECPSNLVWNQTRRSCVYFYTALCKLET